MRRILSLCLLPQFLAFATPALAADAPSPSSSPASSDTADLKQQLADAQDKLSTALHSYSVLEDADGRLKDQADKDQAELAVLRVQAPLASQAVALRDRVRQLQDEVADLASENARLRTRLALQAPLPGGGAVPRRSSSP